VVGRRPVTKVVEDEQDIAGLKKRAEPQPEPDVGSMDDDTGVGGPFD
jgi:hypothetical protein